MFANATVVEIDNRLSGQREKVIVPERREKLIPALYAVFVENESADESAPFEAFLQVDPDRRIRIIVHAANPAAKIIAMIDSLDPDEREEACEHVQGRLDELDRATLLSEARDERRLVEVLAENIRRIMEREGIGLDALAERAGMGAKRLTDILLCKAPSAFLDEVCNLAESLGTTADALTRRCKDEGAQGWN